MKIFAKSLYQMDQVKSRLKVGKVDGIELLFGYAMKEDRDILQYAKDRFETVSLESWDYFYDGAGLDLMSERKDVRETSRRFVDTMMNLTLKYDLFPFSMHLVSGSVPFRQGDNLQIALVSGEENLYNLQEYLQKTYGDHMDRFCFENCLLLDFMGGETITVCNVGKVFEDTIAVNGKACFDIPHYAMNFLVCHEAEEETILVAEKKYPNEIPGRLRRYVQGFRKKDLNDYLAELIFTAPPMSIQRFHLSNIGGMDPEKDEGTMEGLIDLTRMLKTIKEFHPYAVLVPEVREEDYLEPVNQKKFLEMVRTHTV